MSVIMKGSEVAAAMKQQLLGELDALRQKGVIPWESSGLARGPMTWPMSAAP